MGRDLGATSLKGLKVIQVRIPCEPPVRKSIAKSKCMLPSHLSLVHGSQILPSSMLLRDLSLAEGDCMHVVRSAARAYPVWTTGGRVDHFLQCFLLGSPGAGKSVLFRSFYPDHFQDTYEESLGISCRKIFVRTDDEETAQVKLWNLPGGLRESGFLKSPGGAIRDTGDASTLQGGGPSFRSYRGYVLRNSISILLRLVATTILIIHNLQAKLRNVSGGSYQSKGNLKKNSP